MIKLKSSTDYEDNEKAYRSEYFKLPCLYCTGIAVSHSSVEINLHSETTETRIYLVCDHCKKASSYHFELKRIDP